MDRQDASAITTSWEETPRHATLRTTEQTTLFQHVIDARDQVTRNGKIDRASHARVDDELNTVVGLDRDVPRLDTADDLVEQASGLASRFVEVDSIAREASALDVEAVVEH